MDSRFSHLRQRDTSVSMLRVKMSRRRSQSQKENRDRMVNTRRNLGKLQELEVSCLDATTTDMSVIQEKVENTGKTAKSQKAEERLKQLERWKERKALEKEKEKRLKERKGVFKTGVYHPNDATIFVLPAASTKAKEKKVNMDMCHSSRVTRSMKQQPVKVKEPVVAKNAPPVVDKPTRTRAASVKSAPTTKKASVAAVEPVVRALSTRSANRPPVTAAPPMKDKPKGKPEDARVTRNRAIVRPLPPSTGGERNLKEAAKCPIIPAVQEPEPVPMMPQGQQTEDKMCPSIPVEEDVLTKKSVDSKSISTSPSFAPTGFVFQAPAGLSSFKFDPLSPRSAEAFLTPSPSFNVSPCPMLTDDPQAESNESNPPKSSPLRAPPTADPGSPLESNHDVPYFRSEIVNETTKLTDQSLHWESKVEDESIPEEMRDRMRTAVGQARLLMKERFKQFSGLVDDCELSRGEKITTCTDLQGFWDMIYFQVEDVNKKFDALKTAEGRDWVEEHKPPPRQRKIVKKAAAAPSKPAGTKAAAKSRLAAIKAAMKAKKQAEDSTKGENTGESQPKVDAHTGDTVVFDAGFFMLESPAKPPVSVRRSVRLSAAMLPPSSPRSTYLTPRRSTRRSNALAQVSTSAHASPARITHTHFCLTLEHTPAPKSKSGTPHNQEDADRVDLSFSSVKVELSGTSQLERSPSELSQTASTEEFAASVPELNTSVKLLPTVAVVVEKDEPAEPMDGPTGSQRLSLSLCETLPLVSNPTPNLSFTLSPGEQGPMETQPSVCRTPDTSITDDVPGLDTRYFQPHRCSLSPLQTVATETLSPMVVDVEMESPRGQHEDQIEQQEQGPDSRICPAAVHSRCERQDTSVCVSQRPDGFHSP
ncbi:disks large-associated protein 5 isoform X2 [Gouania willdenowi]|uniref:disks large-associated protein 5 isoform X2 n=1 Tax=Gouania willdenowi TaxID=441366 RepID=UPI001055A9E9|nr:disks large-associated protein 5 isoform X2 [Gouania willdenowi]